MPGVTNTSQFRGAFSGGCFIYISPSHISPSSAA
jgi:hypothetical protein